MFERPHSGERAVLVHVELPASEGTEDAAEFRALVVSAGAEPVAEIGAARRAPEPRLFVGRGKADEIRAAVEAHGGEVVVFNQPLTPAQERNLERVLECRVLDRHTLILDIFAQRASTYEGKLQVELAQLRHLSTRLVRGWTHLERQKGGIGLRGPGEKQLETDRRLVGERIHRIRERLGKVGNRRELSRRARARADVPVVSLVGYTNAGKSTLFNRLTGAGVLTADRLFATLDPTLRRIEPRGAGAVVIADTVGFIRNLPHSLVAAFRATLEETRKASLLLHVVDASAPDRDDKIAQVNAVLAEIGADGVPQLQVFNKCDRLPAEAPAGEAPWPRVERDAGGAPARVWMSAATRVGLDLLEHAVGERCAARTERRVLRLPATAGRLRARLYERGSVAAETVAGNGDWILAVALERPELERLRRDEGLDGFVVAAPDGTGERGDEESAFLAAAARGS